MIIRYNSPMLTPTRSIRLCVPAEFQDAVHALLLDDGIKLLINPVGLYLPLDLLAFDDAAAIGNRRSS